MAKLFLKRLLPTLLILGALVAAGPMGCADHEIHLDKLQVEFQSAPPETRAELDKAVADINAVNFPDALAVLQKVAFATKMTTPQRQILEDTIRKVRSKIPPAR